MLTGLRRISQFFEDASMIIAMICLVIMTVLVFAMVITRYLFGFVFPWTEEFTMFLMTWAALLGAGVVLRRRDHIAVNFMVDYLPENIKTGIRLVLSILIIVYLGVLTRYAVLTAIRSKDDIATALRISMFWPYSAIFVTSGLMLLFSLVNLAEDIVKLFARPSTTNSR